jgi:aspartate kinase
MPGTVAGVASERDILVVQASGDSAALIQLLDDCGVSGKQLQVASLGGAMDGTTVIVSRENLHNEDRLRCGLADTLAGAARIVDGLGAVSIIGAGINATYRNVRRGSARLTEEGVRWSALSTSSFRTTWLVERQEIDAAVRILHATFIEQSPPAVP